MAIIVENHLCVYTSSWNLMLSAKVCNIEREKKEGNPFIAYKFVET